MQKGDALSSQDRKPEAINAYSKALEINANLAEGWVRKGNALFDLGRIQDAISAYTRALDINPALCDDLDAQGRCAVPDRQDG